MPRPAALLVALSLVALPVAAAPIPEGQGGPLFYYPTRVGDRLTYKYPTGDVVHVVTAVEKKGTALLVTVGTAVDGGKVSPLMKVEVSDGGLVMLQQGAGGERWVDRDPPHRMLKLPFAPGQRWDAPIGPGLPARYEALREEAVRVPAGEFRAVAVDLSIGTPEVAGRPFRFWFARGLGPVKWETANKGEVVLKAFAPGKDRAP